LCGRTCQTIKRIDNDRGDKVAATARSLASIADLKGKYGDRVLTLELDVTKPDQAKAAVNQAHAQFGKLDIILNNAGYSLVGVGCRRKIWPLLETT
jgi:NADP-dependent 3-hydroxy acid dehydrogenase YdfG